MSRASAQAGPRAKARRPADAPAFPARSNDGRNTGELAVLLAALLPVLSACVAPAGTASDAVGPEKGHATGKVVDTRGNAVAGAKILLDNTVFYASYINGSTRPDGTYRIRLQPGAWKAQASLVREYNGRTYSLRLHPDNIDAFDEQGAVRNFTWKLEGRHPESDYGYYGGFIQLSTDLDFSSDLDDIELTLTPSGPLIDGSPGKALQLRLGDHYWRDRTRSRTSHRSLHGPGHVEGQRRRPPAAHPGLACARRVPARVPAGLHPQARQRRGQRDFHRHRRLTQACRLPAATPLHRGPLQQADCRSRNGTHETCGSKKPRIAAGLSYCSDAMDART